MVLVKCGRHLHCRDWTGAADIITGEAMQLEERDGDITEQDDMDAIVNAWNRNIIPWWLLLPQGVSGAIKRRAGREPFRELGYRPLPLGEARLTSAGRLPNKAIIHVAGINMLWMASEDSIRNSACSAVRMAEALSPNTVHLADSDNIFVRNEADEATVRNLLNGKGYFKIRRNANMFPRHMR